MKRTLIGVIMLGLVAFAIAANGQPAKSHGAKSARTLATTSICPDPSKCPLGCSRNGAVSATPSATRLEASAGICSGEDPTKCPAPCRKAAAGATAERIASR